MKSLLFWFNWLKKIPDDSDNGDEKQLADFLPIYRLPILAKTWARLLLCKLIVMKDKYKIFKLLRVKCWILLHQTCHYAEKRQNYTGCIALSQFCK